MRRILVTGANKGIGLAIVRGILQEKGTFALIGSRDAARGRAALEALRREEPSWAERAMVLELDVSRDDSVSQAAATVASNVGRADLPLYGLVNNAGIGGGSGMKDVLEVNTRGTRRVCDAFLLLLDPSAGRIVNVTSASGPNFVKECSAERRRFFLDPKTDEAALEAVMQECIAMEGKEQAFRQAGLGDGNAYGLSKACANTYTQYLALKYPNLRINACTPGFIETDMTRRYAESQGKSPAELGMKPPAEGARSTLFLLFGDLEGNGRYYGSDAQRSPLDRYRSPGAPPYTGD